MAIRLVAVDVDGTLVTADQRVLPRVQAAAQLAGVQRFVLTNVTTVDSAGLALLAELAARARAAGAVPRVEGQPAGLADLQAAYRLTPELDFPA